MRILYAIKKEGGLKCQKKIRRENEI